MMMDPSVKAKMYSGKTMMAAHADIRGSTVAQACILGFVTFQNKSSFDNLKLLLIYISMVHIDPLEVHRLEEQCRKKDDMSRSNNMFPNTWRQAL